MDKEVIYKRVIMIQLNSIKKEVEEIIRSENKEDEKVENVVFLINTLQPKIYRALITQNALIN